MYRPANVWREIRRGRFLKSPNGVGGFVRRAIALAATLLFSCATAAAGAAPANALESAKLTSGPNGGAELLLSFTARIPQYTVSGENSPAVDVAFTDVALGTPPAPAPAGPIRSVSFEVKGSGFVMHIALSGANALGVNRSGKALDILVAAVAAPPSLRAGSRHPRGSGAPETANVEVMPLKYADVSEVAGILSDAPVAASGAFRKPASIFALPQAAYGGQSAPQYASYAQPEPEPQRAERITPNLAIDRRLNAAVLSGPPDRISSLRSLIERIDVPAAHVNLDCDVVELTRSGAEHAGLDFNGSGAFASASLVASNLTRPLTNVSLQARMLAEVMRGEGRLIASPRISAPSGQTVRLLDGEAIPVVSSHVLPGAPPVIQENVGYVNVGVHIDMQPRVSADNTVTSRIFAEFSNVTAKKGGPEGPVPQVTLRQTNTSAVALDGQPFLIGGFLHVSDQTTYTRTPLLGSLPLVGRLFRVKHRTYAESNLYILITPHIVR